MPDGPNLRGSAPLHHIDSVHLRGEGADHHEHDDEEHNGDVASTDLESAPPQPVRRATDMIPAEERQWKDDIVGWDSKSDVRPWGENRSAAASETTDSRAILEACKSQSVVVPSQISHHHALRGVDE